MTPQANPDATAPDVYDGQNGPDPNIIPGVAIGRTVHYVLPHGRSEGQHRAATIVRTWRGSRFVDEGGIVNLQVFTDGENDGEPFGTTWRTSVHYDPAGAPGTWHFPEFVP